MVKIRLQRIGRKKAPLYHIIVADSRSPRDGKYIENIGSYNPTTIPATISIDKDKALNWLQDGAQPTDTVNRILKYKGILYHKHLLRGVKMSKLTQEQADAKWAAWEGEHQNSVMDAKSKGKTAIRKKKNKKSAAATA